MLGGYPPYTAARIASLLRQGSWTSALHLMRCASRLPQRERLIPWMGQFVIPIRLQPPFRLLVDEEMFPAWLDKKWFDARDVHPDGRYTYTRSRDVLKYQLVTTLVQTSLPMLLRYEDRNSMAHSIESRVPFLTPDLVNLALSFPEEFIISRDGVTKNVFRAAMAGLAPAKILERQDKIGFATPEKAWLNSIAPWVNRNLERYRGHNLPMLDATRMIKDWEYVRLGKGRFDWRIWRWNNLIVWSDRFNIVLD
jgi:asparagine synthase (glutamine-hydrolysing)